MIWRSKLRAEGTRQRWYAWRPLLLCRFGKDSMGIRQLQYIFIWLQWVEREWTGYEDGYRWRVVLPEEEKT